MKVLFQGKTVKDFLAMLVIGVAITLTGCIVGSGNSSLSTVATQSSATYPGNLSGQLFDATTGNPISGVTVTIELVQGATIRTPDTLITSPSDPLAGDYGFSNIPVEQASNQFKLVVSVPGYQHFESEFPFIATTGSNATTGGSAPYYSKIGDVYLYPVGATAAPVVVHVKDANNKIVAGATVELLQYIAANSSIAVSGVAGGVSPNILPATAGLTGALTTAVTDATGAATFLGSSVALGAEYIPVVLATTANGYNLATATGTAIIAGATGAGNYQSQTLTMTVANTVALAEVARSFSMGTTPPLSTGVLNVIFNQNFTLANPASWSGVLTYKTNNVITNVPAASATVASVTATVTGSSLVLTPTFTGTIPTGTSGVAVTYTSSDVVYLTSTGQAAGLFMATLPAGVTAATVTANSWVGASAVAAGASVQLN